MIENNSVCSVKPIEYGEKLLVASHWLLASSVKPFSFFLSNSKNFSQIVFEETTKRKSRKDKVEQTRKIQIKASFATTS